jgi:hypothetical protein
MIYIDADASRASSAKPRIPEEFLPGSQEFLAPRFPWYQLAAAELVHIHVTPPPERSHK